VSTLPSYEFECHRGSRLDPVESTFKYLSAPIMNIHYSRKCSGRFHVAEGERKDGSDIRSDNEGRRKVDTTESGDEEVISPASYVVIFIVCEDTDDNI
jgi:hypothetical protein